MDSRQIDAVVTSTNYRLAPKCHFPVQFEDVYTALKCFLHPKILERCVDPGRIGISGDSTRGNLDARMTQQEHRETAVKFGSPRSSPSQTKDLGIFSPYRDQTGSCF
ncbi:arylacetamide deacetylase-like [Dama dama]|uniref:arylacetamide deacetylase-like n=1 Tax=Dama dama TaxID=30532 RepID=UPI002A35ADC7|nr:arylacetamide deacetylase-like [Dama dama]